MGVSALLLNSSSDLPHHRLDKAAMMRLLRYPSTMELATEFRDLPTEEIMRRISALIVRDLRIDGLENIPATGPALIVSNHPTGIADGIVLRQQHGADVQGQLEAVAGTGGGGVEC